MAVKKCFNETYGHTVQTDLVSFGFAAYGNLANILSAHGKKTEAEWAYKKALTYRSNMADVHYNLYVCLP